MCRRAYSVRYRKTLFVYSNTNNLQINRPEVQVIVFSGGQSTNNYFTNNWSKFSFVKSQGFIGASKRLIQEVSFE